MLDIPSLVSKSDLLDEELTLEIEKEVPKEISAIFISSITQSGIEPLKDEIWKTLN